MFPGMEESQEPEEPAAAPMQERNVEEEVAELMDEERDESIDDFIYENAAVLVEEPMEAPREPDEPVVVPMQARNVEEEGNVQVPVEVPVRKRPTQRAGRNGSMYNIFWKVMIF